MSDSYWRYVEPVWDSINIYEGADIFLKDFTIASEKQKVLFASHWAQSEIMNGGLGQFFLNSTGVLAPEAVEGFNSIGMKNCASTLQEAMKFFGDKYPRDRSLREDVFEDFYEKHGEDAIPIEELEDKMATELEDECGGYEEAANEYANKS